MGQAGVALDVIGSLKSPSCHVCVHTSNPKS